MTHFYERTKEQSLDAAERYILRIRNPQKQDYAVRYWRWLCIRKDGPEPERACSYMAAQAVRLELNQIHEWAPAQ